MTINELDQGLRNLIASQPMVSAGVNGEVINGISSLIDAYRNLSFRVQSYPSQDVMKFGLSNELSKIENTFTSLAIQVLQERGINLMLYIPRTGAQYGPMVSGYGMVNTVVDPSVMVGQMMYSAPMPQAPLMPMPNNMVQPGRPVPQAYPQMQPTMNGLGTPQFSPRQVTPRQGAVPTFPGYGSTDRPVKLEPAMTSEQPKPRAAQARIKEEPKRSSITTVDKNIPAQPVPEPEQNAAAAEMLMGAADKPPAGKAQGRDYLLELLKK